MQDFVFGNENDASRPMEPYMVYGKEEKYAEDSAAQRIKRDMEYFRSLYPAGVSRMQVKIEEACDKMEYHNSPMYDEFPDRILVNRIADEISMAVAAEMDQELAGDEPAVREIEEVEVYELNPLGAPPPRPPQGPPPWGPPPRPPQGPGPVRPPQGPPPWGPPPRPPQGPPPWGPPPRPPQGPPPRPPQGPPPWGPPPRPPQGPGPVRPPQNWLADMARILLLNELQRRRCC